MTKPLTKNEKAHRANMRKLEKQLTKKHGPKKATAKPKKKPAAKAKKAPKRELSDKDLNDIEEVVSFLAYNCPDDSSPVTAEQFDNEAIGGPRVFRNAVKLGRIVEYANGYRLAKGHKGAKKAQAKKLGRKARARKLRDTRTVLPGVDNTHEERQAVGYILRNIAHNGPATVEHLTDGCWHTEQPTVPKLIAALVQLGWLRLGEEDCYCLVPEGIPLNEWVDQDVIARAPTLAKKLKSELKEVTKRAEGQAKYDNDSLRMERDSCDKLRGRIGELQQTIAGHELRAELERATLRLERFEYGLVGERFSDLGQSLEDHFKAAREAVNELYGKDRNSEKGKPGPTAFGVIEAWQKQLGKLLKLIDKAKKWQDGIREDRLAMILEDGRLYEVIPHAKPVGTSGEGMVTNGVDLGMGAVPSGADLLAIISAQPRERGGKS